MHIQYATVQLLMSYHVLDPLTWVPTSIKRSIDERRKKGDDQGLVLFLIPSTCTNLPLEPISRSINQGVAPPPEQFAYLPVRWQTLFQSVFSNNSPSELGLSQGKMSRKRHLIPDFLEFFESSEGQGVVSWRRLFDLLDHVGSRQLPEGIKQRKRSFSLLDYRFYF
ncbi:hypothetical protein POM88_031656 [Heracleum sosnowskyi]|uniref:Uncharacterized protein n=1 Tax=Heracleum sosnowskyi TaxID=360622 RepID=A0AAD8HZY3_9APIA|nr:hypothetical protein POM88_031656 [Heracleum sosnowskyi]